ncbi:MAG: PDZ domain-containing protein [Verrucomicrobiota bacterium]
MQNKIYLFLAVTFSLVFTSWAQMPASIPSQGLVIGMEDGLPVVEKIYWGTAGASAGFEIGDRIVAIGDVTTASMTPRDVSYALDYNPGSKVGIAVQREGETKYLFLNRKPAKDQWKLAAQQDKEAAAASKLIASSNCPPCMSEGEGTFSCEPGKLSYTSPDIYRSGSSVEGMEGTGFATYDTVYAEMTSIREQLAELTQSVDVLSAKVDRLHPGSSTSETSSTAYHPKKAKVSREEEELPFKKEKNPISEWWDAIPENQTLSEEFNKDFDLPENQTFKEEFNKFDHDDTDFPENDIFDPPYSPSQGKPVSIPAQTRNPQGNDVKKK